MLSAPGSSTLAESKQRLHSPHGGGLRCLCVILILGLVTIRQVESEYHPHRPFRWVLRDPARGDKVIKENTTVGAPTFTITIGDLFPIVGGPNSKSLWGTYWCPSSNPGMSYCNYPGYWFCGYWGCETIVTSDRWKPKKDDEFLRVTWGPNRCDRPKFASDGMIHHKGTCTHLNLEILHPSNTSWAVGKMWSVFIHKAFTDPGVVIQIIRLMPQAPQAIGPNPVLNPQIPTPLLHNTTNNNEVTTPAATHTTKIPDGNPLWKMMQASYQALNKTNPNLTEHCWLCYGIKPPFYEAVGVSDVPIRVNVSNPAQCIWDTEKQGITLAQVVGSGVCVGKVPKHKERLCVNKTQDKTPAKWLIPANNTKWVCSTMGVTPCLSLEKFDESSEYCVQVTIVPKIFYHSEDFVYDSQITPEHHLSKREPLTALTIADLMMVRDAGMGTGVASLVQQSKEFGALRMAVDEDLARSEQSVRSPSEVALQNQRGLDLMFLQQGGVCAALKEECCVYVDHTGIVRDSMAKLRERLEKRKRKLEAQQSWFASWFNHSPWLTTLISTLIGPITMIVIVLIFGPCIFNRLVSLVKSRREG